MENHTTTRQAALYTLTIRQESTKYVRKRACKLTDEKYKEFAKLLNVLHNGFTLLDIELD